jgi:hypothetical protein
MNTPSGNMLSGKGGGGRRREERARSLCIYIAGSYRNLIAVRLLTDALREAGHLVLDWTLLTPPLPPGLSAEECRAALDSDDYGDTFDFCASACAGADLVIYLGPSGQDAACEVGMACSAGVPVVGITTRLDRPGLILGRAVSKWYFEIPELLADVAAYAERGGAKRRCRVCGCVDNHACPGGCWWVDKDLCSACAEEERPNEESRVKEGAA